MKRALAMLYISIMLLLTLAPLRIVQSQEGDLTITIEPRDECIAGYPCEINVSIENLDGTVLLDYVKLITPWGAFTRNLGLRELRPNSTILLPILVNIDRNSLEGSNFVRPVVRFFKKGEIGLKLIKGNASSIVVIKPRVNASLLAVPRSLEIYIGNPLVVDINYEVEGIPKSYRPIISVYVDGYLEIKRELNGTSGEARLSVPVEGEGNHTITVNLCYGIGCVNKSFEVTVKRKVAVVLGYSQEREELSKNLDIVREKRKTLQKVYERAAENGLPVSEAVLVNFSVLDSKIKDLESLLAEENISYVDIVRAKALLNQSSSMISDLEKELLEIYRSRIMDLVKAARLKIEGIRNLNKTEYEKLKNSLDKMKGHLDELNLSSIPDFYLDIQKELDYVDREIEVTRERAAEEARLLSEITVSLIFIAMISGATIILRKWKSELMKE